MKQIQTARKMLICLYAEIKNLTTDRKDVHERREVGVIGDNAKLLMTPVDSQIGWWCHVVSSSVRLFRECAIAGFDRFSRANWAILFAVNKGKAP
jgi:hypothetical protein